MDVTGIPHTFIVIKNGAGITQMYGFAPATSGNLWGAGQIFDESVSHNGDVHPWDYTTGPIQLTTDQYNKVVAEINNSIANPPYYNLPASITLPGAVNQCATWANHLAEVGGFTAQLPWGQQGWNPYGQAVWAEIKKFWTPNPNVDYASGDPFTGMPWGGDPLVPVAVPYDPIVFDLDGDGIETVGLKAGVKFDGNADGIKTTTGWVGKDDGMLVWDRNGNGQIDSGRELFGDQTVLANGQLAAHGFAALAAQDTNRDGKVNALDANFAQFKVWQDLNQDGISQANELFTLEQKGIKSVNVQASENANGGTAFDGGRITQTGSYTKTDGTTGTAGNLLFNQDNFHTEFVNKIAVSDAAKTITNWKGAGFVRDLQEAATLDAEVLAKARWISLARLNGCEAANDSAYRMTA
jgi:hypothetical protein